MSSFPSAGPRDAFAGFPSRRSVVHGTKGIVSTVSPLATQAGLRILREGGNAADAAVAAAAVLGLVDPSQTGIGGDAFALFYDASTRKVSALNGSGRSAASATRQDILRDLKLESASADELKYAVIPPASGIAVTVPGAAAAWVDVVERFGSRKVGLKEVLAPAIELADEGCGIGEVSCHWWQVSEEQLRAKPNGTEVLRPDRKALGGCRAPRVGEVYRNELLAKTMRLLAEKGKAGFYEGEVAEAIVTVVKQQGGYLTLDDLKHHSEVGSEKTEALPFRLHGDLYASLPGNTTGSLDLWEHLPNGQGIVAQQALGLLQELHKEGKLPKYGPEDHNSAKYIHALTQVLRLAFADGIQYIADPSHHPHPATLLSQPYLASRAKLFDPDRAAPWPIHGHPELHIGDTVYLAVTDAAGNACSFINSVADNFGSLIVPKGTGFTLHCRGAGFQLAEGQPNVYAPRKRPYNTIIPALVTRPTAKADEHDLVAVLGVMGGAMQPQGHVQVLLNMSLFGMDPQQALDAPRICIGASVPGKSTDPSKKWDEALYLEDGISEGVARELADMGHEVVIRKGMSRGLFGRGQIIMVHEDDEGRRMYAAGSDPRGDGHAAPLV